MKCYSILSTFPSISFQGSIRLPACDSEPCLYLAQEPGLESETGHRCLLQYFAGLQTKLLLLLSKLLPAAAAAASSRSIREGLVQPPLLHAAASYSHRWPGCIFRPRQPHLLETAAPAERGARVSCGCIGGVDHLAAADTKRCNRHEFCPERKGLSTLALIIGLGREEV